MSSHNTPTLTPAGDSLGTATPIGGSDIRNSYLLELGNFNDFYSFIASSDGELTVSLTSISTESELSADFDLIVYDEELDIIPVVSSKTGGRFDEEVTFEATQGTEYFIWVDHYAGGASNYSLITSFTESGDSSSPDQDPDTPTEPPDEDNDPSEGGNDFEFTVGTTRGNPSDGYILEGTGTPGATVTGKFNGQENETIVDSAGSWQLNIGTVTQGDERQSVQAELTQTDSSGDYYPLKGLSR